MENAILSKFKTPSRWIDNYKAAVKELAKAQRALDKAADKVKGIDPDKARLMAELDPKLKAVLEELGLLH